MSVTGPLVDRNVLLGLTGSIAAYKGADLCRLLRKAGAEVKVVMTKGAMAFITPLTLQALSGHPVEHEVTPKRARGDAMEHISLGREADVVVVAPASADFIARAAAGRAVDLLSCVLLATGAPVVMAPAMNPVMWAHPLTGANVRRLVDVAGYEIVGPEAGETACGEEGPGRMSEPEQIVAAVERVVGGA